MTRTTQYVDAFWVSVETGFLFIPFKTLRFSLKVDGAV